MVPSSRRGLPVAGSTMRKEPGKRGSEPEGGGGGDGEGGGGDGGVVSGVGVGKGQEERVVSGGGRS